MALMKLVSRLAEPSLAKYHIFLDITGKLSWWNEFKLNSPKLYKKEACEGIYIIGGGTIL